MSTPPETQFSEIATHYSNPSSIQYEAARLETINPSEFYITKFLMQQRILEAGLADIPIRILEIGVGFGHYSEFLLQAYPKSEICLVDITQKFLDEARARLEGAGVIDRAGSFTCCSATQLSDHFGPEEFDVVLCLGPLYHLLRKSERQLCVNETLRVLKPGGVVFAAAINRMAAFRDFVEFGAQNESFLEGKDWQAILETGVVTKEYVLPIGIAFFHTYAGFKGEMEDFAGSEMEDCRVLGVEGFTQHRQESWTKLTESARRMFLQLLLRTQDTPEGYGNSDHFLFLGTKRVE